MLALSTASTIARPAVARRGPLALHDSQLAIAAVVGSTLFNAVLALGNANGLPITSAVVIGCEILLTGAALVLGLGGRRPETRIWAACCGVIFLFALANGFGSGGFDPKFIRDVLIIPVFVLLGLRCDRANLIRTVLILQAVVLAVMIFEAVRPEDFGRLLNVQGYYINTRGFQADSFWNQDSDLFVSATRPGERFLLGGLDIHRLSSVFLEPVSLGNYCVIVAIFAASLWPQLTRGQRVFLVVSEVMIVVGCDGRFATVAIAAIVALAVLAPSLPRFSNWLYLPGVMAVAAAVVTIFGIPPGGDDFPGRTAGTILSFRFLQPQHYLGFATPAAYSFMDSGIVYLIVSQSLVGAAVIWSFITLGLPQGDRASVVAAHGVALYVALLLLISYSIFSIKTAALLWFGFGAIARPLAVRLGEATASAVAPPGVQPA